jgi:hypothetical protein
MPRKIKQFEPKNTLQPDGARLANNRGRDLRATQKIAIIRPEFAVHPGDTGVRLFRDIFR